MSLYFINYPSYCRGNWRVGFSVQAKVPKTYNLIFLYFCTEMKFTAQQIATKLEGTVDGDPDAEVFQLSKSEECSKRITNLPV